MVLQVFGLLQRQTNDLCDRKRPGPVLSNEEIDVPWSPEQQTTGEPLVGAALAKSLSWNLEAEYSILSNTPLYRSFALHRHDLLLAWALLGDFTHCMFFPPRTLVQGMATQET